MAIDFPASPTNGQTHTVGSTTWTWDGTKWGITSGAAGATDKIEEGNTSAEVIDTGSDGRFVVTTEGTEALRVDSSRRLLVGTTTARLVEPWAGNASGESTNTYESVGDSAPGAGIALGSSSNTNVFGPYLYLFRSRGGTVGSNTVVASGDNLGTISFAGADGTDIRTRGAAIYCEVDGTPGANDMPGRLIFATTADGAASPTERLRITNDGKVLIGSGGTPTAKLDLHNDLSAQKLAVYADSTYRIGFGVQANEFRQYTHQGGFISFGQVSTSNQTTFTEWARFQDTGNLLLGFTSSSGSYRLQVNSQIFATSSTIATSDGRFKENVATLNGCIDLVKALRPVSFTWKPQQDITRTDEDGNEVLVREGLNFPDGTQVGFIAQEVQQVLSDKPWLSSVIKENVRSAITDDDGNELAPAEEFLGIAEGNLVAVLTSALKECIGRIETLEAQNASQAATIAAIEARLTALEGGN